MTIARSLRLLALLTWAVACGSSNDGSSERVGNIGDAGAGATDPFCRTRPKLDFCEDFDETDLQGRFSSIEGARDIVVRATHPEAPSPPFVVDIVHTSAATDARLLFQGMTGAKYNLFFFVNVRPGHGQLDVAGLEDGDYQLEFGLEDNDLWYVEERVAGSPPKHRTSETKPTLSTFWSARIDVYVDGGGKGHLRFRSGGDTVFLDEPLSFAGAASLETLTPRFHVGARLRSGAPAKLTFDSIAVGEE